MSISKPKTQEKRQSQSPLSRQGYVSNQKTEIITWSLEQMRRDAITEGWFSAAIGSRSFLPRQRCASVRRWWENRNVMVYLQARWGKPWAGWLEQSAPFCHKAVFIRRPRRLWTHWRLAFKFKGQFHRKKKHKKITQRTNTLWSPQKLFLVRSTLTQTNNRCSHKPTITDSFHVL